MYLHQSLTAFKILLSWLVVFPDLVVSLCRTWVITAALGLDPPAGFDI